MTLLIACLLIHIGGLHPAFYGLAVYLWAMKYGLKWWYELRTLDVGID